METKILEVRDRSTAIPVIAFRLDSVNAKEEYLLSFAGFGGSSHQHSGYVFVTDAGCKIGINYDIYGWEGRTMPVAHKYINDNFDSLKSGDVIDVQFILNETGEKKFSMMEEQKMGLF